MQLSDHVVDPHIHLFDVHGTPRLVQPLVKSFGWNRRLLNCMANRAFPASALNFFGRDSYLLHDYLPDDYRAESRPLGVAKYVHIEAGWKGKGPLAPVGETTWLGTLDDGPAAIVGHADLTLGNDVQPVLEAHQAASSTFRGVRYMLTHHPSDAIETFCHDPHVMADPNFNRGLERLTEAGLSFDAWCYDHQLADLAALAAAHPDLQIVLNHMGTPVGFGGEFHGVGATEGSRADLAARWRAGIEAVAANPNVHVKLSGALMPAIGFGYEHADLSPGSDEIAHRIGPLVRHCVDAFGPTRCMVASNFPVDKISASYAAVFHAMEALTATDGPDAQRRMFAGTATDFYRL